jgi:hypothetical protein
MQPKTFGKGYGMSLMTVEALVRMRAKSKKRTLNYKRFHLRSLASTVSMAELEARVEQMAEEEELMSRYEHGQEKLPKCGQCGEILGKEKYHLMDDPDLGEFCSEYCAEKYAEELEAACQ